MHAAMPLNFATLQRIFFAIGCVSLAVSCVMTYKFGATMSMAHAIGLVGVTICAAFIFPAKKYIERLGDQKAAKWLHRFGVFFICVELFSHAGYTIGMREMSAQSSGVQTAAYEVRQEQLKDEKANLAMWREHLAKLQAENAWVATVTPDGLKAQIVNMEGDRVYKRSKECANVTIKESRDFCDKLASLRERVALATQANDLSTRIEATQRLIDQKSEVAATTDKGFSAAKAQTGFVSQVALLISGEDAEAALNPDQVTQTVAGIFIGLLIAFAGTFLPTTAFYLAFFGRADEEEPRAMTETHRAIHEVMNPTPKMTHKTLLDLARERGMNFSGAAA